MSGPRKKKAPLSGSEGAGKSAFSGDDLARFIDQTLLKPTATETDVVLLCKAARNYRFHAVCVNPYFVPLCRAILSGFETKVATVIGFPLGASMKDAKVREAELAVEYGADELDIVINIGAALSGNWDYVESEIAEIIRASSACLHKIIIETCHLPEREKLIAVNIAAASGAAFIKTSTGFGPRGATIGDVRLIKGIVKDRVGVKAAGGIRTYAQVVRFIKAGATRIGTSAGEAIMSEALHSGI